MFKPRLKLSHQVIVNENGGLCFGEAGRNVYSIKEPPQYMLYLIELLDGTNTTQKIIRHIGNRFPEVNLNDVESTILRMQQLCLLEDGSTSSNLLTIT